MCGWLMCGWFGRGRYHRWKTGGIRRKRGRHGHRRFRRWLHRYRRSVCWNLGWSACGKHRWPIGGRHGSVEIECRNLVEIDISILGFVKQNVLQIGCQVFLQDQRVRGLGEMIAPTGIQIDHGSYFPRRKSQRFQKRQSIVFRIDLAKFIEGISRKNCELGNQSVWKAVDLFSKFLDTKGCYAFEFVDCCCDGA